MAGLVVTGIAVAYAAIRYHVFAGVPWHEFPLFVVNKGISLASVVLCALAYLANRRLPADTIARDARRRLARQAGLAGFALMVLHVAVSLAILDARHYPVLLTPGGFTAAGVMCLVMGTAGALVFVVPAWSSAARVTARLSPRAWKRCQQLGYVALAFTSAHVLAVGQQNFTALARWPGALPPISLISFVVCLVPIAVKLASIARRR